METFADSFPSIEMHGTIRKRDQAKVECLVTCSVGRVSMAEKGFADCYRCAKVLAVNGDYCYIMFFCKVLRIYDFGINRHDIYWSFKILHFYVQEKCSRCVALATCRKFQLERCISQGLRFHRNQRRSLYREQSALVSLSLASQLPDVRSRSQFVYWFELTHFPQTFQKLLAR